MANDVHSHDHPHDHPHDDHAPIETPEDAPPGRYELMTYALRDLLIEKGVVTADQLRASLEWFDSRVPSLGARVVAKAWTDPDYKARLLADGKAACAELGVDIGDARLIVIENSPAVHNVVVCTLCSCYPRTLLGLPPDWYKSKSYRSRVVSEPRDVLKEFGTAIPDDVGIRVHDSTAELRYLILPMRPAGTEGWTAEQLEALVTRDCMVGVTVPKVTQSA